MRSTTYCRKLEDGSGFVIVRTIFKRYKNFNTPSYIDQQWEEALATGTTKDEAWSNYRLKV
jgi:hypothetical protein